jgi:hypothetical protein
LSSLAALCGQFPTGAVHPRRIAGLLATPGCTRRQVVEAAAIDLGALASVTGARPAGQSPYARERDATFARQALNRLPALVNEVFATDLDGCVEADLSHELSSTAALLRSVLADDRPGLYVLRRPALPLNVNGERVELAADLMIMVTGLTAAGAPRVGLVELRSYAMLDGVADPGKVAGTARELAVLVVALREFAATAGLDPARVGTVGALVLPRNLGLTPIATRIDVAPQVRRLVPVLAAPLFVPAGPALPDPAALDGLPARFGDGCPGCDLYAFCRDREAAAGSVARAGATVVNLCGTVGTVERALALADGATPADDAERAIGDELSRAAQALAWAGNAVSDGSAGQRDTPRQGRAPRGTSGAIVRGVTNATIAAGPQA